MTTSQRHAERASRFDGVDLTYVVGRVRHIVRPSARAAGCGVVNADLRGWGTSDGVGELLFEQEGRDGHDLVEWIAAQPWCDGHVGMLGVSYRW